MTEDTTIVPRRSRRPALLVAGLRLVVAALVMVAILATLLDTASRASVNPFNFFGFFTIQSNIIAAAVLLCAAVATFRGRGQTPLLVFARACGTTYIVIVGIVYNLLLTGLEGGVSLGWANWVLHAAFPVYAALDWIVFGDRPGLRWSWLWLVLMHPLIWIIVVLIRGATDGWVPYPFLDPATGYGSVALYCVGIAVAVIAVAALVFAMSRRQLLAITEGPSGQPG